MIGEGHRQMHCGSDQQGCDQGVLVQKGAVERHNRGKDHGDCVGYLLGGEHFVLWVCEFIHTADPY